jgi:hypothetical protein
MLQLWTLVTANIYRLWWAPKDHFVPLRVSEDCLTLFPHAQLNPPSSAEARGAYGRGFVLHQVAGGLTLNIRSR